MGEGSGSPFDDGTADNSRRTASQMAYHTPLITSLNSHADILLEVKTSIVESTYMTKAPFATCISVRNRRCSLMITSSRSAPCIGPSEEY